MSQQPDWQYHEKYEKEQEKAEKEHEKQEKTWEEKWQNDPLGAATWAVILIWAGFVFLTNTMGWVAGLDWFNTWGVILTGAGVIVLLATGLRLIVPAYRRPIMGGLILGIVLIGLGLGNLFNMNLFFPLVLIAIGIGILLRIFMGRNEPPQEPPAPPEDDMMM